MLFPSDRLYSIGHTWIQASPDAGNTFRFGIDSFAAAVICHAQEVSWGDLAGVREMDDVVCRVDLGLGVLPLRTPIAGRVRLENQRLESAPELLVSQPYSDGWLLECDRTEQTDFEQLVPAGKAQTRTELDLQRFRRRVAHGLLADTDSVGSTLPDGGELITDLRQMLGGSRYLEILRELVH
jgi:glycine cleavage system H lipoate-binding protein